MEVRALNQGLNLKPGTGFKAKIELDKISANPSTLVAKHPVL